VDGAAGKADYIKTNAAVGGGSGAYKVELDVNLDGLVTAADVTIVTANDGIKTGRGKMSAASVGNKIGAGQMEWKESLAQYSRNVGLYNTITGPFAGTCGVGRCEDNPIWEQPSMSACKPLPIPIATVPVISSDSICRATLAAALADSRILQALANLGAACPSRSLTFVAKDCGKNSNPDSARTACSPISDWLTENTTITLCTKPNGVCPTIRQWIETILHELEHAKQICNDGCIAFSYADCKKTVVYEIDGYCAEPSNLGTCRDARDMSKKGRCIDARALCLQVERSLSILWPAGCGSRPFEPAGTSNGYHYCMSQFNCYILPHGWQ